MEALTVSEEAVPYIYAGVIFSKVAQLMWQQSVKFWYQMLQFEDLCLNSPAAIITKSFPTLQTTTICFSSGVYIFTAVNLIYLCSLTNRKMNQTYWLKHSSSLTFSFSLMERGKNRGEKEERSNKSTCWREKKEIKKTIFVKHFICALWGLKKRTLIQR